jgi:hypothetical protein
MWHSDYFFDFLQTFYAETRQNEIDAEILSLIKEYPEDAPELASEIPWNWWRSR